MQWDFHDKGKPGWTGKKSFVLVHARTMRYSGQNASGFNSVKSEKAGPKFEHFSGFGLNTPVSPAGKVESCKFLSVQKFLQTLVNGAPGEIHIGGPVEIQRRSLDSEACGGSMVLVFQIRRGSLDLSGPFFESPGNFSDPESHFSFIPI